MKKTGQPIILTIKGKEVAVVHDPDSYQEYVRDKERLEVIAGVLRGIEDVKPGRVRAAEEVFDDIEKRFGMGK